MVLTRLPLYVGTTLPSSTPVGHPARVPAGNDLSAEEIVVAYHERTKHHYHRFAASVGYMDWATQPDPFRRYEGASLVRLPFPEMGQALPYWQLYVADSMEPAPLSIDSVSLFLRYALSLTAWKRFHETTWSLRANPSSGNLHPTEGYALLPAVGAIHDRPGVYHYAPKEHGLELLDTPRVPSEGGRSGFSQWRNKNANQTRYMSHELPPMSCDLKSVF